MGLKKKYTREDYENKYGLGAVKGTQTNDFSGTKPSFTREDYENKYGTPGKSVNLLGSDAMNRLMKAQQEDRTKAIEIGKRNQNLFSDNALIQKQLRQETGPSLYDLMDTKEKENYFYEIGKNGNAAGKAYLEQITPKLQKMAYETATKNAYEGSKNSVLAGLANNMVASMGMGAGYIDDAIRILRGKEINPYSIGHTMSEIENVSRQAIKENARENIADSPVTDFLVDTGLSMGQNIARMPISALWGPAGMIAAGLGAATKGAEDARDRGATNTQSLLAGGAQGAAEALAEKIRFGSLKALKEVPVNAWKDVGKNVVKQAGTEALEEAATELANTISDRVFMGNKSNWSMTKEQYDKQGYGEAGAWARTIGDTVIDIGLAALGGGISGGIMGGGISGLNAYQQNRIGKSSDITDYQEFADSIETDEGAYENKEDQGRALQLQQMAQEFADRQINGEELSNLEKGRFEQDLFEFQNALSQNGKTEIAPVQEKNDEKPVEQKKNVIDTYKMVRKNVGNVSDREDIGEFGAELGEYGKKALTDNYDGSVLMNDYRTAFNRYYDAGRHNVDLKTADRAAMASVISDEQSMAAYKAGVQDRNAAAGLLSADGRYVKGREKTGSALDLSGRATEAQMNFANQVGKKTGLRIELVDGTGDIGGVYNRKAGTIRISVDSDNFLQTTSHELTHFIKDYARIDYEVYSDICVNALMNSDKISYDDLVSRYEQKYMETGTVKSRDEIMEEIVADATGRFLNDEDFVKQITKENRTVAQKIVDFISDMIDSIKQLITTNKTTKVANVLREQLDYYEDARDMWAYGLESAGERYRSGDELAEAYGERYQLNEFGLEEYTDREKQNLSSEKTLTCNTTEDIRRFVENANPSKLQLLYMGNIGTELADTIKEKTGVDVKGYSVVLRSDNVVKIKKGHGTSREALRGQIPVTADIFARIPEIIAKADSVTTAGKTDKGKPALRFEKEIDGNNVVIEYVSDKRRMLYTQTMWVNKKNPPTTEDVQASSLTSKTVSGTDSDLSIKETLEEVNGENKRFQLKDPMEETKNLIAVHNLTADKLLKTFQLEGIPMPSIAITKADIGHETFGDISLLFRKDTIDPKKKKNKVYSADAWTPTFPRIEYEANKDVLYSAYDLVRNLKDSLPEEYYKEANVVMNQLDSYLQADGSEEQVANRLKEKTAIKALYLASQGEKIEEKTKIIRTEKEKNSMFEGFLELFEEDLDTISRTPYKELYEKYADKMRKVAIENGRTEEQAETILAKKSGIVGGFSKTIDRLVRYAEKPTLEEKRITDYEGMKRDIEGRIDPEEYGTWVDELVKGLMKDSGILNGKELFTSSGKRRSFKDTHYEVTAKNIVKSMLTQGSNAKNIAGFFGIKTIRAEVADEFKSINDIKESEMRLQNLTEEEFEAISEKLTDRLDKVMNEILESSVKDADYNRFIRLDNIGLLIQSACDNPTADNIRKQFSGTAWQITDEQVKEIQSIVQDVRDMPVNMFEAKPQRVVEYDEIEAAVVPNNVSEDVLMALDQKGIRVITYDKKEQGARAKAVNSVEGIRFQLQGIDEGMDTDSLLAENAELRKANEYLTQQLNSTKDYAPGLQDIERIASRIRKEYGSTYPQARLVENLQKLYNYIRNSEQVDGEEVTRAATAIGRSIIEKAEMKDTAMKEQYQDLLDHVKNTKIVLPERFRSELDAIGGYTNFRKRYFGKIKIGNSGVDVDTAYEELASLYPGLFDASIVNPADQIVKIAEVVDMVRPTVRNPYHANMDEAAYLAGQEIFKEYFNVRSLEPTRMDKMDAQVYQLRQKYEEQLNSYKLRLKAEYEGDMNKAEKEFVRLRQALSDQYKNTPKEATAERAEIRKKLRELEANADINKDILAGKLKYQRRRDASEARKHKMRIIKDVSEMAVWLEKPTDKKHVPEALRVPLADFLKDVDFSSNKPNAAGDPTSRSNSWRDLKDLFGKIVANGGMSDKEGDFYMEVDPDIAEKMDTLKNKVQDFDKMENLDLKDLRTLREVIQSMKRCVIDANYMYENKMYERIEDVADAFQKDNRERKDKIEYAGTLGKAMRMMQSDMLDAQTMFERMGPAATSVYKELRDGFDKKIRNTKAAQDYMTDLLKDNKITEKDIREWSGKKAKVYEFDTSGGKVKFTTAQIMSLYAQNKREQARGHIYSEVGGIKAAPTVRYDKAKKGYVIDKQHAPVKVTPYDVIKITEILTPEQKNLADGIVKFFTTQTSEWGNEVTLRMYGYKKFMAPNYFPIVTDKNYLATKNSEIENSITTLKNMGATKSTVYKANNPIIIEDIFDVFTRQADQMGSYNAFVIPLSDMQKFLNHKVKGEGSVKETVDRIFGPGGQDYIKQLMVDVNGASTGTKDLTSAMTRNMKAASVGANLRTAIQQPTAYARAMIEIDSKYLAKGLATSSNDWDMAKKYAPIVQWKEWGYFDINTGRSMKNILMGSESLRENLTEKSMWLTGKADEFAWKHLWEAAKAETRDLHPELAEGSEEFYIRAGNRLTEIIDKTQVVDSVLHRSKLMKSNNGLVQMYTSFMSEPTKTYNMLYRAIAEYGLNKNDKSKKMLQRTLVTWAVSNAVTAMAAAVIDAMRDEDDEKALPEKYMTAVTENMVDNFNPVNMVPLLRDVESIWSGYQVLRTDMQAMQQTKYAWDKIEKYVNGESDLTIPGLMYECSKALSLMTGVPVNNALRDLNAAVNTVLGETGNVSAIYSKERMFKDIESTGNLKRYVSLAMKAYYQGDKETGDRIITDLKTAGIDESKIETKYKTALKDNSLVSAAAEARVSGNYGEYESLVDELEDQGLIREYVEGAVASVANKLDPDANFQTGFGYADVTRAYRTSKTEFDRVVNSLIEQKKAEKTEAGKEYDEADVISQIKSRFTKEYKEDYVNGNDAKRKEIRTSLYQVKVKGKQLFSEQDFKKWMK